MGISRVPDYDGSNRDFIGENLVLAKLQYAHIFCHLY